MTEEYIKMAEHREIVRGLEIERYRSEQKLAFEKFRAQSQLEAILNSRTWRYSNLIRKPIAILVANFAKKRLGLILLKKLDRFIP